MTVAVRCPLCGSPASQLGTDGGALVYGCTSDTCPSDSKVFTLEADPSPAPSSPPEPGETPMGAILCPACARPAKLQAYTTKRYVPRVAFALFEAQYTCEGGHDVRVYVSRTPAEGEHA